MSSYKRGLLDDVVCLMLIESILFFRAAILVLLEVSFCGFAVAPVSAVLFCGVHILSFKAKFY